jgi:hypothetical protein
VREQADAARRCGAAALPAAPAEGMGAARRRRAVRSSAAGSLCASMLVNCNSTFSLVVSLSFLIEQLVYEHNLVGCQSCLCLSRVILD